MHQTTHFFNLGYGWLCKHCCAEDTERKHRHHGGAQKPQGPAFARWIEQDQFRGLICTRCNISENLSHKIPR